MNIDDLIKQAAQLIYPCKRIVAFSGAGVSAESGISTYRDAGGLWDRYPEGSSGGILTVLANHPEDGPQILKDMMGSFSKAVPNPGHIALAELEKMGYLKAVVTQNVDNLHNEAGNSTVYELHGNLFRLKCLSCGKKKTFKRDDYFKLIFNIFGSLNSFQLADIFSKLPLCSCGGNSRIDFVGFGEQVQDLNPAMNEAANCELILVLGTSGVVEPAASIPVIAKSKGAKVIEINPTKTVLTSICDLFLEGATGNILPRIVDLVRQMQDSQDNA